MYLNHTMLRVEALARIDELERAAAAHAQLRAARRQSRRHPDDLAPAPRPSMAERPHLRVVD